MDYETVIRLDNIIYWVVTMVIVVLTTIKQFNRQERKNKNGNDEIITNLHKIEKQNIKMLNLLELHSQDIKTIKKDINVLEHRVSRLEDSHVNLYKKMGDKPKNDNS
ncbi:hypothetical protein [Liberiplasma polymorphum]|uniref:hypothetical protein n=1 Tax=Liberiplasma polymorphum TaxID=3374570 RepID=UPI003776664F